MKIWPCAVAAVLCFTGLPAVAHDLIPTAVFDIGFDDTSLQGQEQGPHGDEQARLVALDSQLRQAIAQSGCCAVVALDQAVAKQAHDLRMESCDGCELPLARKLGARISVTGWVQKVSNLILNINVVARDVPTGKLISAGSVDIRGNTDQSWSRGLTYLVRNRLHPSEW
jgi:hypothetical protein